MEERIITSVNNKEVKRFVLLQQKSAERRKSGRFVVEGRRELEQCIAAGFRVETLFFCPEILSEADAASLPSLSQVPHRYQVSLSVYEKMAYRGSTEGVLAIVEEKRIGLENLSLKAQPLIVVLESVEKPGNIGAILRSADAAAVDAVIVCNPLTDLFNPNIIRSSLGGIFSVPVAACSTSECIVFLQSRHIRILTAQLQDSKPYYETEMRSATALVMGTESVGLSQEWRKAADAHINIPMQGKIDSLNVSVSAAILMFEAVRQRFGSKD